MSYTIAEVSKLINLSKVSIYRKLKLKEVKEHITKRQGITYIDQEGFNLIKYGIKNDKEELKQNLKQDTISPEIATDVNLDKEMLNLLKDQLKEKDKQIQDYSERLRQALELNKNSQILQLRQQPQDIKQLEEHFQELDTKLEVVKENMIERKEQQNKGFFRNIFKK